MKGLLIVLLAVVCCKESCARPKQKTIKELFEGYGSRLRASLVGALEQMSDEELVTAIETSIDLRIQLCVDLAAMSTWSPPPPTDHRAPSPSRVSASRPRSSTPVPVPTDRQTSTQRFSTEHQTSTPSKLPTDRRTSTSRPPTEYQSSTLSALPTGHRTSTPRPPTKHQSSTLSTLPTGHRTPTPRPPTKRQNSTPSTRPTERSGSALEVVIENVHAGRKQNSLARLLDAGEDTSDPMAPMPRIASDEEVIVELDSELGRLARGGDEVAKVESPELAPNNDVLLKSDEREWDEVNDDGDSSFVAAQPQTGDDSTSDAERPQTDQELNSDMGEFESLMSIGSQTTGDLISTGEVDSWVGVELYEKPSVKKGWKEFNKARRDMS